MAAPLLARSFGELPFAVISAIAFTTVLGTVSGLIMAASGAVAHDLMTNFLRIDMNDHAKVRAGKIAAVVVGVIAMVLGILFEKINVSFLVGWAFNVAASANLPALVMLLFWKRTTKQGITAAIIVGMVSSLGWILLSAQAYQDVYGLPAASGARPLQPAGDRDDPARLRRADRRVAPDAPARALNSDPSPCHYPLGRRGTGTTLGHPVPHISLPEGLPGITSAFAFRPETAKPDARARRSAAAWTQHPDQRRARDDRDLRLGPQRLPLLPGEPPRGCGAPSGRRLRAWWTP